MCIYYLDGRRRQEVFCTQYYFFVQYSRNNDNLRVIFFIHACRPWDDIVLVHQKTRERLCRPFPATTTEVSAALEAKFCVEKKKKQKQINRLSVGLNVQFNHAAGTFM